MKTTLTGPQIESIRSAMDLRAAELAAVLWLHPGTLSRWRSAPGVIQIDGIGAPIMQALSARTPADLAELGEQIRDDLYSRGPMRATARLLTRLT